MLPWPSSIYKRLHMALKYTIALDAMGGDIGPAVVVPAALRVVKKRSDVTLVLVGDESKLKALLSELSPRLSNQISIQHASETVAMDEPASRALRYKKDSSMRVAINLVKSGVAQACVSAGNTGALMATARYVLKTLPGIDRPAIIKTIPSIEGHTHVLDLGANVDCASEHLFQFALMGSVLCSAVDNNASPRVGLLNIGEEEIKGNERVKLAGQMLAESDLNYIGFVEGDDISKGGVDVVVCDGFVGNIALKTMEGIAKMIAHFLKQAFERNLATKLAGLLVLPILNSFRKRVDPRRYNGASLVGLRGIVIKSHGSADALSIETAIDMALVEVDKAVPQQISANLEKMLAERQAG